MRSRALASLVAFAVLTTACAHTLPGPSVSDVVVLQPELKARVSDIRALPFSLNFADGTDGTMMMQRAFDQAFRSGARYIADLTISIVWFDRDIECTSHVFAVRWRETRPYHPKKTTGTVVLEPVTRTVTETRHVCRSVTMQDGFLSKQGEICGDEPFTHEVSRYEFQLATGFIPVDWDAVVLGHPPEDGSAGPEWTLTESEPDCHPLTRSIRNQRTPHRVVGTIYVP